MRKDRLFILCLFSLHIWFADSANCETALDRSSPTNKEDIGEETVLKDALGKSPDEIKAIDCRIYGHVFVRDASKDCIIKSCFNSSSYFFLLSF